MNNFEYNHPKFKIHCHACNETFGLNFRYLIEKPYLNCPNCHQEFRPEILNDLKGALIKIEDAIKKLYIKEFDTFTDNFHESFSISIEWDKSREYPYGCNDNPTVF